MFLGPFPGHSNIGIPEIIKLSFSWVHILRRKQPLGQSTGQYMKKSPRKNRLRS